MMERMSEESLVIGLDLGGTKMNAAVVDAEGRVVCSERQKTLASDGASGVIERIVGICVRLRTQLADRGEQLRALAIGVPGAVDDEGGVVDKAPNLGWEGVQLAEPLEKALGVRVFLDNDVRVAVLGEHAFGVGRGTRTLVGLFVGTGVGGGVVIDGHLHRGGRGVAGEVGHMTVLPHGPRCGCGRRGCVEALASRTAMLREVRRRIDKGWDSRVLRLMKKEGRTDLTSSVIEKALALEDPLMQKVVDEAQYYLGLAAGSLANLLDPEVIVIGGGVAERLGERFVAPIRAHAYKHLLAQRDRERVQIVPTALKDLAAPLGAAFLARQRLSDPMRSASRRDPVDSATDARHGTTSWPVPSA
jgi:glucokinase